MKIHASRAARHATGRALVVTSAGIMLLVLTLSLNGNAGLASPANSPQSNPQSADWPMWRYDASRSGATPAPLPAELRLQWVRELPTPAPAWSEEQYKLQFDRSYEPVVMGQQIFVPSMVSDKVTAFDTETGKQNWEFFCDGPVRFAPIAWQGRVYCASDDGNLYCLNADDGKLLWKSRLAPSGRNVLGNGRVISAWSVRGGPVLHEGKIYCAAGIWPFMGVFIRAIDPGTGRVIWENSGTGAAYIQQQHSSPAFAGVAPQGYLAASGNKLLVTSRTIPACFDCNDGALLYYHLSDRTDGKYIGGCSASIWQNWYFNNKFVCRLADGLVLGTISAQVMTNDAVVGIDGTGEVVAYTLAEAETRGPKDKKSRTQVTARASWKAKTDPVLDRIHLQAGDRLYGSNSQGAIAAVQFPAGDRQAQVVWNQKVEARVWSMLAGDGKLFVVTEDGRLYCFGADGSHPEYHKREIANPRAASREDRRRIRQLLEQCPEAGGYCLWLGTGNGGLLKEILRQTQMHVIVIEPDVRKVASWRQELDRAGLYGARAAVLQGDISSVEVPPYIASLIVVEDPAVAGLAGAGTSAAKLYSLLRPYTGTAWIAATERQQPALCGQLVNADLPGLKIDVRTDAVVVKRAGPVPGSADWTHQYGDVANTVCSKDQLQPPLGILWFGEESAFGDVLPRHGHGPPEQVVAGRLFIEGIDSLSARDVYTGRTLWKASLKDPGSRGVYYDSTYKHDFRDLSGNQRHIPGANVRGTNFVATPDQVYVLQGAGCHVLDAKTGQTQQVFSLPDCNDTQEKDWGYIGVSGDYLIAGVGFARYSVARPKDNNDIANSPVVLNTGASEQLVVMNRHTGQVLWTRDAQRGFLHNGIVAGKSKVFCLDAAPPQVIRRAKETAIKGQGSGDGDQGTDTGKADSRPVAPEPRCRLLALDIHSGRIVWDNSDCVFGSWLGLSESFDILLQAHRKSRDMPWEPGDRMAAFRGETGEVIWDKKIEYTGPCMLLDGTIITQESAYSLLTGQRQMREHPLTREPVPWKYSRNYGCGTAIASQNLLTFRSAAAGYYDLANDGGTGNFGGFRSGCTSNLVIANGVLNAPDYTETCTCSYQNQTSLAMIHMPEVEMWTFSNIDRSSAPLQRVGINFGAPGDRMAGNGTLWLEYPSVGGNSPRLDITVTPEKPSCFRRHSLLLGQGNLKWVEASGARGVKSIRVRVSGSRSQAGALKAEDGGQKTEDGNDLAPRFYTVRLHFLEPDDKKPGERVFDVALGEQTVLKGFDIMAEAKSSNAGIMKEFPGIHASDFLTIALTPADPNTETIICGVEIIAEGSKR